MCVILSMLSMAGGRGQTSPLGFIANSIKDGSLKAKKIGPSASSPQRPAAPSQPGAASRADFNSADSERGIASERKQIRANKYRDMAQQSRGAGMTYRRY